MKIKVLSIPTKDGIGHALVACGNCFSKIEHGDNFCWYCGGEFYGAVACKIGDLNPVKVDFVKLANQFFNSEEVVPENWEEIKMWINSFAMWLEKQT